MKLYVKERPSLSHAEDSAAAKALLLEIMKTEYGVDKYDFVYSEKGKPYFAALPYFFSYSHCKRGIACAVDLAEIGVDIQDFRKTDKKVIARVCTPAEAKSIVTDADFAKIWAIKEAYSKLTGKGFSEGFSEIDSEKLTASGTAKAVLTDSFALAIASEKPIERLEIIYL